MNRVYWLIGAAVVMYLGSTLAHASDRSMRCGRHLIYAGGGKDSAGMYEVLKKCGEPEAKYGDKWVYVQGNMRRTLTFRADGRLFLIESKRN